MAIIKELVKDGIPVVYAILNRITGRVYIGSTDRYRTRISKHKTLLRKRKHTNKLMQDDCNDHGFESFEFLVLEIVGDINDLGKREREICIERKAYETGYNRILPSENTVDREKYRCAEHRALMSMRSLYGVKLVAICGKSKDVLERFETLKDAALFYEIDFYCLSSKLIENSRRVKLNEPLLCTKGIVFLRAEDYVEGMEIRVSMASLKPHGKWDTRPVTAENPKTGEVRDYASVRQAARDMDVQQLSIHGALKTGHKCNGFYWKDSGRK